MKFYKKQNGKWVIGDNTGIPSGSCVEITNSITGAITIVKEEGNGNYADGLMPTEFQDINGNYYSDLSAYETATCSFFVDASSSGGTSNVIDMKPGEYLIDKLELCSEATAENPIIINFYNHSKTINWNLWKGEILWPAYVYINFKEDIDWYPMGLRNICENYDEGFTIRNPMDKMFMGIAFNAYRGQEFKLKFPLPLNLNSVYFGGLDEAYFTVADYEEMLTIPWDRQLGPFNVIQCGGDRNVDGRNRMLYKRVGQEYVPIAPNIVNHNLIGVKLIGSYMRFLIMRDCDLQSGDLSGAEMSYSYIERCSFKFSKFAETNFSNAVVQECDFTGSYLRGMFAPNASFERSQFMDSDLSYVNFVSANLTNVLMKNCNLNNTDLRSANICGTDLQGCYNLSSEIGTKAMLIGAVGEGHYDTGTIWIDGTSILV